MTAWRALAPAKVNLGLFVGSRRADGKHEIVSVMQSISLADELTLCAAVGRCGGDDELDCPGVQGPPAENLAMRALAAFRESTGWREGALRLDVVKHIPVAAGLGGGSGDAAATLRLAAAASGKGTQRALIAIAGTLGADVPAQVSPGRWLARGAGERLQRLPDDRGRLGLLVLPSAETLSTAAVYGEHDRISSGRDSRALEERGRDLAAAFRRSARLPPIELLENDLEDAALSLCPSTALALDEARAAGADVALVSGSGPTVIGLFDGRDGAERAQRAARSLSGREPPALAAAAVDASFGAARDTG